MGIVMLDIACSVLVCEPQYRDTLAVGFMFVNAPPPQTCKESSLALAYSSVSECTTNLIPVRATVVTIVHTLHEEWPQQLGVDLGKCRLGEIGFDAVRPDDKDVAQLSKHVEALCQDRHVEAGHGVLVQSEVPVAAQARMSLRRATTRIEGGDALGHDEATSRADLKLFQMVQHLSVLAVLAMTALNTVCQK